MSRPKRNFRLDRSVTWDPVEIDATVETLALMPGRQVVYRISHKGFEIPVFAFLRPETGKLAAFGQESLDRSNTILPLFYRWSWHERLPESSLIVFNDPTLTIHSDLGCCWSQGTKDQFALEAMRDVLVAFCERLGMAPEKAILFGASAGGFWAMMTGAEVGSRTVVVDSPQTDLFRYHDTGPRDAMLRACYPKMEMPEIQLIYPDRLRVIDRIKRLRKAAQNIVFVENSRDVKHIRTQWTDFFSELNQLPEGLRPSISRISYDRIGDRGQTHTTMETDATVQILANVLAGSDPLRQP